MKCHNFVWYIFLTFQREKIILLLDLPKWWLQNDFIQNLLDSQRDLVHFFENISAGFRA